MTARNDVAYYQTVDPAGREPLAVREPSCLYLEVTNECNLACKTCPITFGKVEEPVSLTLTQVQLLVSQFSSIERVVLHGVGEPLLNRELPKVIAWIRDPALWVGLYRITLSFMWLQMALQKAPWIIGPEGRPYGWLYGFLWKQIEHPTFEFYTAFLKGVVLPNFGFFGFMVFVVEMVIGISLLLGLLVPLIGGLGGMLMQINIAVGSYSIPDEWFWLWPLMIGSHVVFMMGRAGRRLGLDGLIAESLARPRRPEGRVRRLLAYVV